MTVNGKHLSILAACMAASLGAAFATAGTSQAGSDTLGCEIAARSSGGATAVEGLVHAGKAIAGSYSLSISGNGTNIRQAGEFDARAGETVTLGSARLGGSGGSYDVKLQVSANGAISSCAERVGGWL